MALQLADRVQQTGTANTTVSFTLSGSVTGYQSFAVVGNGNTTYYAATDSSGNWEVGVGTYSTTGPTLTRTTILSSSNSGSAVTFSGTVNVFVTYPSEYAVYTSGPLGAATATSIVASNGFVSTGTYGGSFADGIVLDYATGNGRISVGSADGLTFYTGGVANTSIGTVSSTGVWSVPTVVASNGLFSVANFTGTYTDGIVLDYVTGNGRVSVGSGDGITFYTGGVANTSIGSVSSSGTWTLPTLNLTNALGTSYGGTGLTSFTANGVVYASSTSALATGSNLVFDGTNLGIGISAPTDKLDVTGTSRVRFRTTNAYTLQINTNASGASYADEWHDAGQYIYEVSGTEKMRLNTSGYLGIGTNSPSTPLHIYTTTATSKITLTDSTVGSGYGGVLYGYGVAGTGGYMEIGVTDGSAGYTKGIRVTQQATSIQFFTGASSVSNTEIARFDSSGNLGIGATSITSFGAGYATVQVNGSAGGGVKFYGGSTNYGFLYGDQYGFYIANPSASTAMVFQTNGSERMRINSSGYVGINNTSPNALLQIGTSTTVFSLQTPNIAETVQTGTAPSSTQTINVYSGAVVYFTSNTTTNWTVNLSFNSGTTSMNTALATNQSVTFAVLVTQGSTAYYNTAVQVDGTTSGVTTKWQGGAPTSGNASGIDVYTYTVIKTASATYTVLASLTQFK